MENPHEATINKNKRQHRLQVNSLLFPIIVSVMGSGVMGDARERSGCEGLHVDGATKPDGAKRMAGDPVMGELFVGDGMAVGANNWGTQSWGAPCR